MTIFAVSKYIKELNTNSHEKDISAIEKKKSKQAWFQRKNVHSKRKKGSCFTSSKGKEKTFSVARTQIERITTFAISAERRH